MGLLIDGEWHDKWYDTKKHGGRFQREESQFRNWITADGSPGPGGEGGFEAEAGRYHIYFCYACPWAHRTLIFRKLKGLEEMISASPVDWYMGSQGWQFTEDHPDPLMGKDYLHQVYTAAKADYTGRVLVPTLWDKKRETIVSNESSEIIRMFNSAFDDLGAKPGDYYPQELRGEIDAVNEVVYHTVNNGVYKAGFATSQDAYEDAFDKLFDTLDKLEERLSRQRYLAGERITEADWRLFTTLLRFDPVYVGHFKCNKRRIVDYPNLWAYTRELYQWPGVVETVNLEHIKKHYYGSHETVNPTLIVPKGPLIDFTEPHGRDHLPAAAAE
ncbi:MAG: glutathione S-transferase family protein [Rhodovibrionaceae bacterium]|nr:glutathione S-transferase family protein [Rhodovibrionaceae bacterium]